MTEKICNGNHRHPAHFNTGSKRHIWLCLTCRRQLRGSPLSDDEREVMIEFAKYFSEQIQSRKALTRAPLVRKEETMTNQITVTVSGASRVEIAKNLRAFADNLDGAPASKTGKVVAQETADEAEEAVETEDEEFAPKKKPAKKAAASFDDEAEEEATEEEAAEEVEEEAPKAKKAKAPTKEDVNEACKAHAKRHSFDDTKALLLKKFKTSSVSKLKPEQYPAVIAAMKG